MRAYFQLFIGLLIPLSALFMVAAVLYFKIEYNYTKAMRLGVLFGFFIAIAVSLFTALLLLILRQGTQPKKNIFSGVRKRKKRLKQTSENNNTIETKKPQNTSPQKIPIAAQENIILLMDNSIAFEILLYIITEQKLGQLTKSKTHRGQVFLKTHHSIIKIHIIALTKHTSQMHINSDMDDTENIQKIIRYMKEKESYFTQS